MALQVLPIRPSSSSPSTGHSTESDESRLIDQTPRKTRTSGPKVRTGCVTCKIRRVKCDETKPACTRCTSTGRQCDGYYIPPRKQRRRRIEVHPETVPAIYDLPGLDAPQEETRALEYFHARTAPSLASYFDVDFWSRLVLQVGHAEPTIRHACAAVASLHREREQGREERDLSISLSRMTVTTKPQSMNHDEPFAIAQYNKAISYLKQRLSDPDGQVDVAILTCILFVCLEFLRGDVESALRHFTSGMKIAIATIEPDHAEKSVLTRRLVKDTLLPVFNRLELLAMLFGFDPSWEYPVDMDHFVPNEFHTIKEARDSLVHVMCISMRLIRHMRFGRYDDQVQPENVARQSAVLQQHATWKATFDTFVAVHPIKAKDQQAANVLGIHHLVASIWVAVCLEGTECPYDAYNLDFETAVDLAEQIHAAKSTKSQRFTATTTPSSFLFDMELVSPLYFIAIKCRHPIIRRRAIAMLRAEFKREGLWDSLMAASVAQRVVDIEEVHLTAFDGSQFPAEADRVHNAQIESATGMAPDDHLISFHQLPNGSKAEERIWQEIVQNAR